MNRNTGQSVAKGQEVVEEAVKRQTTGFPCLSEGLPFLSRRLFWTGQLCLLTGPLIRGFLVVILVWWEYEKGSRRRLSCTVFVDQREPFS